MSDIVLYTLVSLDGATEDPHRYFPETGDRQGAPVFDEELARLEAEMLARQSAVLLGRRTYDEWSRYWPTSDEQPFADFHQHRSQARRDLDAARERVDQRTARLGPAA